MGTTLTGTTPQDTYDSLIKVTDNGPLSGSLKTLTDGLGNDSALALSTARVGIGTTANYSFNDDAKLAVANTSGNSTISIVSGTGSTGYLAFADGTSGTDRYTGSINYAHSTNVMTFHTNAGNERVRIDATGNVGIGTSTPQTKFQIGGVGDTNANAASISFGDGNSINSRNWAITNGLSAGGANQVGALTFSVSTALNGNPLSAGVEVARFTSNGLLFNGDTAAANALDDYEEGIWTMGVSFGGASTGVTYTSNTGTYTKIGRQVTVNGYIALTSKGSSTGTARITGLPFTIGATAQFFSTASVWMYEVSFANQFQAYGELNTTGIVLSEITEAGAYTVLNDGNFANNTEIMLSLTYFV